MNDVIRLQALVDKKKVVVTEATIREALRLDDAEGVECLPNEEIFAELARMGYEKPSTKLMFYKAFFSSQWKKQVGDLSTHTTKYTKLEVAEVHGKEVNAGDAAEGDIIVANDEVPTVAEEPSIPSPTPPTPPPQPSHDIPSTSQKVGTTQRVETSDETVMDDLSNQGRMIAEMEQDADVVLGKLKRLLMMLSMQEDETEPAEVQEVVDVVTTAKIIIEVVTAVSEIITAASETSTTVEAQVPTFTLTATPARVIAAPRRRTKGVVIRDPQEESTTSTIITAETKSKDKEEQIEEEEESRALKRLNETPAKKAAKRQKLDEEVEELKRHLHIVPNKTMMSTQKLPHLLEREDLEALWSLVKERYTCSNLEESKKCTWSSKGQGLEAIGIMWCANHYVYNHTADFVSREEVPTHKIDSRSDVKCFVSFGVDAAKELKKNMLILLVERKYPLTRLTLDQMLNAVRFEVEEEREVSLELLRFIRQQHQEGQLE
nr:hypothetical protein [Tanacetum cinerariifolium]